MTQIVAFHGEKQSGKNTSCNFLLALKLIESGSSKQVKIDDNGRLLISDLYGEKPQVNEEMFSFEDFINQDLFFSQNKSCVIYAFANKLKQLCIDLFGLTKEQCWGTDEQKNTPTALRWENMPGVMSPELFESCSQNERGYGLKEFVENCFSHESGPMTAREFMQFFGTNIMRKMYEPIWTSSALNQIQNENPDLALICDARFENELNAIKKHGGLIIGFKRTVDSSTQKHASEITNFNLCDAVIDNRNMTISQQNEAVYRELIKLGCNNIPKGLI